MSHNGLVITKSLLDLLLYIVASMFLQWNCGTTSRARQWASTTESWSTCGLCMVNLITTFNFFKVVFVNAAGGSGVGH